MRAKPIYEFAGYVENVRGHLCDLVMHDRTNTKMPDEYWTVATARLAPIEVGQGVKFTITSRRGYFTVDRRVWTAEELADVMKKADAWAERFRSLMNPVPEADLVSEDDRRT